MMLLLKKIYILFICIFVFTMAKGQINAGFTVNDSVGCNTLIAQFTNTSQSDSTMLYLWDFGNGNTSTLANPQVVFNNVGSLTVSLIAYNQYFADTLVKTNYIVINKSPTINDLLTSVPLGCVPFDTEFEAVINPGNAPIETYIWDFGDGTSSLIEKPTQTFQHSGLFDVSLFIQDTNNCEHSYTSAENTNAIAKPAVNFDAPIRVSCFDSLTVSFNNKSAATTPLSFDWDFGNGSSSTTESPVQFYSGFNNYSVSLTATDTYGCTNTLIKPNYVVIQELIASIDITDKYLCKKEQLQVTNNSQGANKYYWDFGDSATSSLREPVKSYTNTGSFEILYIAMLNNSCSDTVKTEIYVDPVSAKFSVDKNYGCEFPFSVQYTNNSINASNSTWLFGNSTQSNEQNPQVDYISNKELEEKRNIYLHDTLIVESSKQCKDTLIIDSNIHLYLPEIYFTPNDSSHYNTIFRGCTPLNVNFQNQSKSYFEDDPFLSVEWSFGDATTSSQNNPTHTYNTDGDYEVKLSVTNQSGCINSYVANAMAGTPQQASFSYIGDPIICGSETATFINQSTDDLLIDQWKWEFTDGTNTNDENPVIQFQDTGYISGELTVFYNGCEGSTFVLDSFVYVNGPAGNYYLSINCDEPLKYFFVTDIKGADFWYYDFGDNTYDSTLTQNIVHEYSGTGNFTSSVEAGNIDNSCSLLIEKDIHTRQLNADFSISETNLCPMDSVTFNPESTVDNAFWVYNKNLTKYLWTITDGSEPEISFDSINHNFELPGQYQITLTAKDVNGCADSIKKNVKVFNLNANYTISDSVGCAPIQVSFTDNTVSDTTIESWFWDFGNSNTDNIQNPTQIFYDDSAFTIKLIVTDVIGCKDTLITSNAVYSSNPIPNFNRIKARNCLYDSVSFINTSQGAKIKTFLWDFGNGETSDEFEPKLPFMDTGYFNISLTIIDSIGCDSTIEKPNYIYMQPLPVADFTQNSYSSSCYPKVIGFTDISNSNDIVSRQWDFGDNEISSNTETPYHTYKIPGLFDVSLMVSTSVGCKDTIVKEGIIEIGGPYAKIIIPDTICINESISIEFNEATNVNSFQWNFDDGSAFLTNPFEKTLDSFGMKELYLNLKSDTLGTCNKLIVDSITIPILSAGYEVMDTALCTPFYSFTQNESFNASSFEWYIDNTLFASDTNIDINLSASGIYDLKLVAINNKACRDSMTKELTVFALPDVGLNNDTLICAYDSIWLNAYNGVNYWWYMQNTLIDSIYSSINVSPAINTRYAVEVLNINGCFNTDSMLIQVQQKPTAIILNRDTTIIIGEELELTTDITHADEILWEPSDNLTCVNCETSYASPLENTIYYFHASDYNNCFLITDSVQVNVDAKYSVDLPNSFTPNGDGINDFAFVMGWGIKELLSFIIYDVNGRIVFETNDISQGWDGNSILGRQPDGMYLYHVNVLSYDNIERNKQGYINLIR